MSIAKISALYKAAAQRYKSFADKLEMNESIATHIFAAGRKIHRNARAVLDIHAKHSCIVTGVSWLNPETVADTLGVHERTIERAYKRLESLGVARRETVELGGMVLRFFILQPFSLPGNCPEFVSDLSQVGSGSEPMGTPEEVAFSSGETKQSFQTKDSKFLYNKRKEDGVIIPDKLDESFVPSNVPELFVKAAAPFYRSAHAIYELWGKVKMASKGYSLKYSIEEYAETAVQALKESVFARKNKRIRSGQGEDAFRAYFYRTIENMIGLIDRQEKEVVFPNWLEENDGETEAAERTGVEQESKAAGITYTNALQLYDGEISQPGDGEMLSAEEKALVDRAIAEARRHGLDIKHISSYAADLIAQSLYFDWFTARRIAASRLGV